MKFKEWLFTEGRTGLPDFYPPLYYNGQYPSLYYMPGTADAGYYLDVESKIAKNREKFKFLNVQLQKNKMNESRLKVPRIPPKL